MTPEQTWVVKEDIYTMASRSPRQEAAFHVCRAIEALEDPRVDDDVEQSRQQHLFAAIECLARVRPPVWQMVQCIEAQAKLRSALCHYLRNETPQALVCLRAAAEGYTLKPYTDLSA
jgi:hypothetical protein